MSQQSISQLQQRLEESKTKFKTETTFNADALEKLKINQRGYVRKNQEHHFLNLRFMADGLQQLFAAGWTYDLSNQCISKGAGLGAMIVLTKPAEIYNEEVAAMDEKTEAIYREGLAKDRTALIEEIASLTLQIEEVAEAEKNMIKKQKAFARTLEQVKQELISEPTSDKDAA